MRDGTNCSSTKEATSTTLKKRPRSLKFKETLIMITKMFRYGKELEFKDRNGTSSMLMKRQQNPRKEN